MRPPREWHVGLLAAGHPLLHVDADDEADALAAALRAFAREGLWSLAASVERDPDRWFASPCDRACPWHVSPKGGAS